MDAGVIFQARHLYQARAAGWTKLEAIPITAGTKALEFKSSVAHCHVMAATKSLEVEKVEPAPEISDDELYGLISQTNWGKQLKRDEFVAVQKAGRAMNVKTIGRMMLVDGMGTLAEIKAAMQISREMSEDGDLEGEVRARALGGIALAGNAYSNLLEKVFNIAKEVGELSSPPPKKVAAPSFYAQVNITSADAKNGQVVEVKAAEVK